MRASRRRLLNYAGALGLAPLSTHCGDGESTSAAPPGVFRHGVASGDPTPDAVILWTRVTLQELPETVEVEWLVASDPELADVVQSGTASTGPELDYTVKVDATELDAGTTYYYRFSAGGESSAVGRTRTLPDETGLSRLRFAVVSCSNYPAGYFNAYAFIARRADLDAVIHLGDYIYEYGVGEFGDSGLLERVSDPTAEIVTLEDYRRRHAQYKTDPDLQEVHRQHVFIAVWDDHEVTNNAWQNGAENHQPETEGDYAERKAAATRAYLEWMPVRADGDAPDFQRSFRFGDLAQLTMLDTRHFGRDEQTTDPCDPVILDPERQLLGAEQEEWLFAELAASQERGDRWRLLGQQVMFGQVRNVLTEAMCPINQDQWDGYASARERLLLAIQEGAIADVVVLTGDIHSSWGIDIAPDPFDAESYDAESGSGALAVEAVTPSVTSPGLADGAGTEALADLVRDTHPHVKHVDLTRHGYVLLDVTPDAVQAEWYYVSTLAERGGEETLGAALVTARGANHLVVSDTPSEPRDDAPAPAPQADT